MDRLADAMTEIEHAEETITVTEVRTKLDSIETSLQEMLDTAAGEETEGDIALADTAVAGSAPNDDNLRELEENLAELAEETDDPEVSTHLTAGRRHIKAYRTSHDNNRT